MILLCEHESKVSTESVVSLCSFSYLSEQYERYLDSQDSDPPHHQQVACHRHHHSTWDVQTL